MKKLLASILWTALITSFTYAFVLYTGLDFVSYKHVGKFGDANDRYYWVKSGKDTTYCNTLWQLSCFDAKVVY